MRGLILSGMREHRTRAMARPRRIDDDALRGLRLPVLVLLGARSPMHDPAAAAARAAALLPHARVVTVEGATHGLPADRPRELQDQLTGFLHRRR